MSVLESQPRFTIPGGGSGPISIEDDLLNHTSNVDAITPTTDFGRHSKIIRTVLGTCSPGDSSERIAVRVRNPQVRQLLTYRHRENGERAGNHLVSTAERITGSHSAGILLVEEALRAHIVGRVIPGTNESNVHLQFQLADGRTITGEDQLDQIRREQPQIDQMRFVAETPPKSNTYAEVFPRANPEAVESVLGADVVVIPPGTWHGSIRPVIGIREIAQAIGQTKASIVMFCNACDFLNWPPANYLEEFTDITGRAVDYAFINTPNHDLPPSYINEGMSFVPYSPEHMQKCEKLAKEVLRLPMTEVLNINGEPTVRHIGKITSPLLMRIAYAHRCNILIQDHKLHLNGGVSLTIPA